MLAATVCKFFFLNVRGLKNINKSEWASFLILRIKNGTTISFRRPIPNQKMNWRWTDLEKWMVCFFSHGTNCRKGVCIILNLPTFDLLIESQYSGVDGRIILVYIIFVIFKPWTISISSYSLFQHWRKFYAQIPMFSVGIGMSLWELLTKVVIFHGGLPLITNRCWLCLRNLGLLTF